MAYAPRVYTIPPGAAFLETLARTLLDGALVPGFSRADAPLGLASATIYVPTRRAARALAAILAEQLGTPSAFLPRSIFRAPLFLSLPHFFCQVIEFLLRA